MKWSNEYPRRAKLPGKTPKQDTIVSQVYDSSVSLEVLNCQPAISLIQAWIVYKKRGDNLMSWITLQTTTGPEEYQVSDLDEVVWWKTENAITAVGYMDAVAGRMTQNDFEICRIKRPEIVREISQQQASLTIGEGRDH